MEGEGAARAALDGAVGGALAGRVAPDEEVADRARGVEVETAACERVRLRNQRTLRGHNFTLTVYFWATYNF